MKKISKEHFERMNMMCKAFENSSKENTLFQSEYEISKEVNQMIRLTEEPSESDFKRIKELIESVDSTKHYNGSQWYDYKIHLNALLRENGFHSNIF